MDQNKKVKWVMMIIWVIGILLWSLWNGDFFHHRHDNQNQHTSVNHEVSSHTSTNEGSGTEVSRHSNVTSHHASTASLPGGKLDLSDVPSYVLAVSWEPGFCLHNENRPECHSADQHPLGLHGFWPNEPNSLITKGVSHNQWTSEGCFALDQNHDGSFCSFAKPQLDASLSQQLSNAMPGVKSCLDRHEYAKHGACFNTSAQDYFGRAVRLYNSLAKSDFGQWLISQKGHQVSRNEIISRFSKTFHTSGSSLMLLCGSHDALTDIRVGIRADQLDNFPSSDSFSSMGRGYCGSTISL